MKAFPIATSIYAAEQGSIHSNEGLELSDSVHYGCIHRLPNLFGLLSSSGYDPPCIVRRDHHGDLPLPVLRCLAFCIVHLLAFYARRPTTVSDARTPKTAPPNHNRDGTGEFTKPHDVLQTRRPTYQRCCASASRAQRCDLRRELPRSTATGLAATHPDDCCVMAGHTFPARTSGLDGPVEPDKL